MKEITSITRRDLYEYIEEDMGGYGLDDQKWHWSGRFDEVDYLSRIYDLKKLPSGDNRYRDAEGDIVQHRISNLDWYDNWVFTDERFGLVNGEDEILLIFLCEMLHPEVISEQRQARQLATNMNEYLSVDGWELYEISHISKRPVWGYRRISSGRKKAEREIKEIVFKLDSAHIDEQIVIMEKAIDENPGLAIGASKEFIESICKAILLKMRGKDDTRNRDFPELVKDTLKTLELVPEKISDAKKGRDKIKIILSNISSIADRLNELRNIYGTGHGKGPGFKGLQPRHAKLVVGSARTLGIFLFDTYLERTKK